MDRNHPHLLRDPKQFMQGYNASLSGRETPNPYEQGGEWHETWNSGYTEHLRYVQQCRDEEAERRRIKQTKQMRGKQNRIDRANVQAEAARRRK